MEATWQHPSLRSAPVGVSTDHRRSGACGARLVAGAPAGIVAPAPSQTDARARARQAVSGPAIGLIVTAIFGLGWKVFALCSTRSASASTDAPEYQPEAARLIQLFSGGLGVALDVFGIAIAVFVLIGALRMQKLSNHGLAVAAAIVAMVPCFSPCCLIACPSGSGRSWC